MLDGVYDATLGFSGEDMVFALFTISCSTITSVCANIEFRDASKCLEEKVDYILAKVKEHVMLYLNEEQVKLND